MNGLKFIPFLIAFISFQHYIDAQFVWNSYFQGEILTQSQSLNPSFFQSDQTHVIRLPEFYFSLDQEGPGYRDFLNSSGESLIDLGAALANAGDQNFIRGDMAIHTIGYTGTFGRNYFRAGHTIRLDAFVLFPFELLDLSVNGNYKFIDKTIEIGPAIQWSSFHEIYAGYGHNWGKLSAGMTVKLLSGIQNISTAGHSISLYTDPEFYQFEIETDYMLNSSSVISEDTNGNTSFSVSGLSVSNMNFTNPGVAFDAGVQYKSGGWSLAASAINIGGINWKKDIKQYTSNGLHYFDGFEVSDFLGDTIAVFDSLSVITDVQITEMSYRTMLSRQLFLSVSYNLNHWDLGILIGQEYLNNEAYPAAVLNVLRHINGKHSLGLQYGIRRGRYANVGIFGNLELGAVQIFGGTDNIIGLIHPFNSSFSNFNIGMNLLLNRKKQIIHE